MNDRKTRRQLLRGAIGRIGAAAVVAAAKHSGAAMRRAEVRPQSPLGIAIADRAAKIVSPDHYAIKARLTALLASNPSLGSLSEECPIRGCPIGVGR